MYACGLRIGEAATLEIGTIDGDNGLLRIIGKGNKERLVPLPEPILWNLRRLWKIHSNPRWLFPTRAGTRPVGRGTLNRTFSAAAQAASIRSATPHSLRHGYAVNSHPTPTPLSRPKMTPYRRANVPSEGAETGGAEAPIAEQSRSWRAASGGLGD
jgi:hypothetical protein